MRVEVEAVGQVTGELVDAAGRLLSQLSRSATPLGRDDLARITSHDGVTLFAARVAANRLYQHLGFRLRDSNVYRYQLP
jgi:hypothetical protein